MVNENNKVVYRKKNVLNVLAALVMGSLAGAILMIWLARQSGSKPRDQIWQGSLTVRDRMVDTYNDLVRLTQYDNRQIPARLRVQTDFKSPEPV
jgi:hypothetical protein